ncbi:hypothetical protein ACIPSA_49830 [Streptomyces sp. NPDC086549]|uniref:hypothetical protein n=1 Tax=Streptomyces sp. NPDC086549 TaxID=3365752 RepID=UPI0037F99693
MQPTTLAASWIDVGNGLGTDMKALIFNVGIPVLCGLFVLVIGFRTRAPGPTLMAVIFAGVVWGLSANMATLKDTTGDTVKEYNNGGGHAVIQGDQ